MVDSLHVPRTVVTQRETRTESKALAVNLDPKRYGTFAEIGAGQEVVRWFFQVGGAAGTIAKSISAYDMAVSDAIYGRADRYVSRERLESMIAYEHSLTLERLREDRGSKTGFFTFADTVAARSYKNDRESHGWMGVRFQAHPRDEDSSILLHLRMLDSENALQQEALGIVGVNLIYAACFLHHDADQIVESLLDSLSTDRIEIDVIEFSGIEFRHVDNRAMSLRLVQLGLSGAAMFSDQGKVLQPSEVLYRRPVLVERGSFRPVTHVNIDMLECAREKFVEEPAVAGKDVHVLVELTMRNLRATGEVDLQDFLERAEVLAACGLTVLVSDYFEYYRLGAFLSRHTRGEKIGIVMGAGSLKELFNEQFYTDLDGGILESFGRLFKHDLSLYVYPLRPAPDAPMETVQSLEVSEHLVKLYGYLVDRGCITQLDNFREEYLQILSRDVLARIRSGDPSWEKMVPDGVAETIRKNHFFGHPRLRSA